jgi:hypothetical protein
MSVPAPRTRQLGRDIGAASPERPVGGDEDSAYRREVRHIARCRIRVGCRESHRGEIAIRDVDRHMRACDAADRMPRRVEDVDRVRLTGAIEPATVVDRDWHRRLEQRRDSTAVHVRQPIRRAGHL